MGLKPRTARFADHSAKIPLKKSENVKGKFGPLPLSQALDEVQPTQP